MKYFSLTALVFILLFNADAQLLHAKSERIHQYVDVFHQHLKILDSTIKLNYDTNNISDSSVKYMERVTHINAHCEANCWGRIGSFDEIDLSLWKNWYKDVGSKRIGMIL